VPIAPPWCGTPEPDVAGALPDGSDPSHPAGSFPHIPYYAIGCTLDAIKKESRDGRMKVEVIGKSAQGRALYLVTINQLKTRDQKDAFEEWQDVRELALDDPARAIRTLSRSRDDVKVPLFIQSGIHGNEYEGVDAMIRRSTRSSTTRSWCSTWCTTRTAAPPACVPTATASTSTATSSRSRSRRRRRRSA
jgi:hypothetical protein